MSRFDTHHHTPTSTSRTFLTCPDPTVEKFTEAPTGIAVNPDAMFNLLGSIVSRCFDRSFLKLQRGYDLYHNDEAPIQPGTVDITLACNGDTEYPRTTYIGNVRHIGTNVSIAALVHVGDGVTIGNRAIIDENATIDEFARIGHGATIGAQSNIEQGAKVLEGVTLGSQAIIGHAAEISCDKYIPDGTKVEPGSLY